MGVLNNTDVLDILGKMFVQLDRNNLIVDVNKITCELTNKDKSQLIGCKWRDCFEVKSFDGDLISEFEIVSEIGNKEGKVPLTKTRKISWHKTSLEDGVIFIGEDISNHENYLFTLHKISSLLLDIEENVPYNEFVRLAGDAAYSDHTYIFLNDTDQIGNLFATKIAEWSRNVFIDNEAELPGLKRLDIQNFASDYVEILKKGESINLQVASFKDWEKAFFKKFNIQAILLIPIIIQHEFFGFVGFDNRVSARQWTNSELSFLKAAVVNLEQSIVKTQVFNSLKASESRFKKLSSLTMEGIIIHDGGVVKECNQAYLDLVQYDREEIIGQNVIDRVAVVEHQNLIYQNVKKKNPLPYEVNAQKKDGTIFPVELEARSIVYEKENLRVVAVRDITERKKVEEKYIKEKNKAEESNRLKTQFLNNMSHEIRTPLNGIIGFTQFLSDPNLPEDQRNYFANIIQSSSDQLLRVIDDIIEISKLETQQVKVHKQEVNLNSVLLEIFSIFELKTKEKNISLQLNKGLSDIQSEIYTDKLKLQKVLNNLVENAVKFTHVGEIEIGYLLSDTLEIWVKDSGIGIPDKNLQVIFDRFLQVESTNKAVYGGLGLGLSIAKENTELLGGEIIVTSNEGSGSKFTMKIPYEPVHSPSEEKTNETGSEPRFQILIAEDEEVNFILLEFLVKGLGHSIDILNVRNGKEAIETFKANRDIDLILMDLKMPMVDGFEATDEIRKLDNKVPIIAVTAYSGQKDKENTLQRGFTEFLTKPVMAQEFTEMCNRFLVST